MPEEDEKQELCNVDQGPASGTSDVTGLPTQDNAAETEKQENSTEEDEEDEE